MHLIRSYFNSIFYNLTISKLMSNDISNYNNWLDAWNDFYEKEKELVELDPNAALVSSVDGR